MQDHEKVCLGVLDLSEAKRIRSAMQERGVNVELVNNPETCSSGKCGARVEMYVPPEQVDTIREFLKTERAALLEGLGTPSGYEDEVFDTSSTQARCPACGTQFSTSLKECPDCGLGFGIDGAE